MKDTSLEITTLPEAAEMLSDVIAKIQSLRRLPDAKLLSDRNSALTVVYSNLREIEYVLQNITRSND